MAGFRVPGDGFLGLAVEPLERGCALPAFRDGNSCESCLELDRIQLPFDEGMEGCEIVYENGLLIGGGATD
jgi:hypothetical protein